MENSSVTSPLIINPCARLMPYRLRDAENCFHKWCELAAAPEYESMSGWMQSVATPQHPLHPLVESLFGNSPYLSHLLMLYPKIFFDMSNAGADAAWATLMQELEALHSQTNTYTNLMRELRVIKGKAALLTALADISGTWKLAQVTGALSHLAEHCVALALDTILLTAAKRGEIELPHPQAPSEMSGIIVLGMGKLGGRELNYSSDIDLIILFDPGRLTCKGRLSEQKFMTRLSHELVTIMQERTPNGYVFRTDLRLRPDPASTPPAISTIAAHYYYESVGQNWERAAMIKARPIAGDIPAGERFLKGIAPFMWRRNLDFASITDIHSIKRQMDSLHSKDILIKGHNIKIGRGGIREIEFFVQIHQLIWGGREPVLRTRGTCETLVHLREYGLVDADKEKILQDAYVYLRKLEHRLQMVGDAQTHNMPDSDDGIAHIACFMGYDKVETFERELLATLHRVHDIYASSFKNDGDQVLGDEGNLVFTGVSHDPETLGTLSKMGYAHPETVSEIVMGWHHGSRKATRSKRARELLTEMMPLLLKRLSETANPDMAFLKFNEFLTNLPSGVQLFSLFNANPHLLGLIADIMGSAPKLADTLSRSPELLDAVLYDDFYAALPSPTVLVSQLNRFLKDISNVDTGMDRIRYFRNEKQFQAGVQLLKGMITAEVSGRFLSDLADVTIRKTFAIVNEEFVKTYGAIAASQFAAIALGKLGSREMTFNSDIDLVFIYDAPDFDKISDGEKGFGPAVYFNRLAQRFVNALSAMGRAGRLYEVDTRLRPSGNQGLLAVSTKAITHYFDELAWTFEYMALTKARVVIGSPALQNTLRHFIHQQLVKPRDATKLKNDAADMRERIEKEHPTKNSWDIKYVRGGLMDMDFLAQYLLLLHAPDTPGAHPGNASAVFNWLLAHKRIERSMASSLHDSILFLNSIYNMLRLCHDGMFDAAAAPPGLKKLLVESVRGQDFEGTKARLIKVEQSVFVHYSTFFGSLTQEDIMSSLTAQKRPAELRVGDKAPDFAVAFDSAENITSDSLKGKYKVIYFYPKDDTPGCTIEAKDFRDHIDAFKAAGAVVIGVSKDSVKSHDKFKEKFCLPFPLASDEEGTMCEDYGVWTEKSMYGKSYMGIERTTFLLDKNGIIRNIWRKVNVEGHVKEVLDAVKAL